MLVCVSESVFLLALHLGEVKFFSHHASVDVLYVVTGRLEVRGGVIWAWHKNLQTEHYIKVSQNIKFTLHIISIKYSSYKQLKTDWLAVNS